MKTWLFTALTLLAVTSNVQSQCTQAAIDMCIDDFTSAIGTSKDRQNLTLLFKASATADDFNTLCTAKDAFMNCITPFMDVCKQSVKYSLQGLFDAANYTCVIKQSADYVSNAGCLGSDDSRGYGAMCLDVLYSESLTVSNWCQKVNDYFGCIYKGATINCNQGAADYQNEVMLNLYQNQATNLHNCRINNRQYYCRRTAIAVCYQYFTQIAGLRTDYLGVPFPFSENEADGAVDSICGAANGMKSCVSYDVPCSGNYLGQQKTLEGVLDTFDYICANKVEYKTNSKCLAENYDGFDSCTRALNQGLTITNVCSKFETYYSCLETGAVASCSNATAEYQTKIYGKMLGKQAMRYGCDTSGAPGLMGRLTAIFLTLIVSYQLRK